MHRQPQTPTTIQTHRMVQEAPVDAGDFADWLAQTLRGLHTGAPAPVPCGDCRGCCTSGYFIPLTPADSAAAVAIPAPLLSPAPGMPPGYQVLGRTAQGACPMLEHNNCAIYPARPQACRAYDCRVFAAAGMAAGTDSFSRINARVRAWRFSYGSHHAQATHQATHQAVKAAARFMQEKASAFPGGRVPRRPDELALLALKVHPVFLHADLPTLADSAIAAAVIASSRDFDGRGPDTHPRQ